MSNVKYKISPLILILFLLAGCNPGPNEKPAMEDLVGTYHLTASSKNFLREEKSYKRVPDSTIELRKDGSVEIIGLPDCYPDNFGRGHGDFLNGKGRWEIEKTYGQFGIDLTIEKGGSMKPAIYSGTSILIKHKHPPFAIEFLIGDPDQGEYISYERTPG